MVRMRSGMGYGTYTQGKPKPYSTGCSYYCNSHTSDWKVQIPTSPTSSPVPRFNMAGVSLAGTPTTHTIKTHSHAPLNHSNRCTLCIHNYISASACHIHRADSAVQKITEPTLSEFDPTSIYTALRYSAPQHLHRIPTAFRRWAESWLYSVHGI
jgi:hypothetical protein